MRKLIYAGTILCAVGVGALILAPKEKPMEKVHKAPKVQIQVSPEVQAYYDLTNVERSRAGDPPLKLEPKLSASALEKCNDMETQMYWSHDKALQFISAHVRNLGFWGENLLRDTKPYTPEQGTESWMNSPKHKENILNPNYTEIGFGTCDGPEGHLVVQHFAKEY